MLIHYFYVNDPSLVITGYIWYGRPQPQILENESVMRNKAPGSRSHIIMYLITTADSLSIVNSNPRSSENCKLTTLWWWVSKMLFIALSGSNLENLRNSEFFLSGRWFFFSISDQVCVHSCNTYSRNYCLGFWVTHFLKKRLLTFFIIITYFCFLTEKYT